MVRVANIAFGCHMSDGTISVALLRKDSEAERIGIDHFGLWVNDMDSATRRVIDAGATALDTNPSVSGASYEDKFLSPDGIVFDLTQSGWPGAAK